MFFVINLPIVVLGCVVMYGSSVFDITQKSEMRLYEVPMVMSLLGFGMMLGNFHVWDSVDI